MTPSICNTRDYDIYIYIYAWDNMGCRGLGLTSLGLRFSLQRGEWRYLFTGLGFKASGWVEFFVWAEDLRNP